MGTTARLRVLIVIYGTPFNLGPNFVLTSKNTIVPAKICPDTLSKNTEMVFKMNYNREIQLQEDKNYIFNIGSVGQSRDHNYKRCFVIYDTDKKTVKYIRPHYNVRITANNKEGQKNHLPKFLYKRILIGM